VAESTLDTVRPFGRLAPEERVMERESQSEWVPVVSYRAREHSTAREDLC
jgi:hypothetical protein